MLKSILKRFAPPWALSRYRGLRERRDLHRFRKEIDEYPARTVSHLYGGLPLKVWITDPVAEDWYDKDHPEANEIEFLRHSRLRPGARVFDIGAHQCVVALMLSHAVGPDGRIVAVEAHPHNAAVGVRNRDLNGVANLDVIHAAVGARAGRLVIQESGLNSRVGLTRPDQGIDVEMIAVDDLAAAHGTPDVIYVDVEGYECQVLRGAGQALSGRPDLMIEVHVGCGLELFGESVASLVALIPDGYDLYAASGVRDGIAWNPGEFVPFTLGDPVTKERFFLAAIGRSSPSPTVA